MATRGDRPALLDAISGLRQAIQIAGGIPIFDVDADRTHRACGSRNEVSAMGDRNVAGEGPTRDGLALRIELYGPACAAQRHQ